MSEAVVALVYGHINLSFMSSLINTIRVLATNGFEVHLIGTPRSGGPPPHFDHVQVKTIAIPRRSQRGFMRFLPDLFYLPAFTTRQLSRGQYRCVVAVDMEGMIAAWPYCRLRQVPMVHDSLHIECYTMDEGTPLWTWAVNKYVLAGFLASRAALTIATDSDRARWLVDHQRVNPDTIMVVPNSPLGPAVRRRDDYLRSRLGIPPQQRIVLYAGAISPDHKCLELAQAAEGWTNELTLVIHAGVVYDTELLASIAEIANRSDRVHLSLEALPYEQLDRIYGSADIGIALYYPGNSNYTLIAGGSGKLAHCFKLGVPVIASDFPSLRSVIAEYRCGECVGDAGDVAGAAKTILADYESYSLNALRCFEERYDFARHFEPVLQWIEQLR